MKIQKDYPGPCEEKAEAGTIRWRVRGEGHKKRKVTVPVDPDHQDYGQHCQAARKGGQLEVVAPVEIAAGTLDDPRERYVARLPSLAESDALDPRTAKSRERTSAGPTTSGRRRGCGWASFR